LEGVVIINRETNNIDNSKKVSKQYAIKFIPTKVLVDKNGIIIGRYDNPAALDKKLAEIFGG
jgi:hypothetical protein